MKVFLRKRNLKSGNTSLYLDIYVNGARHYEFLKLHLVKPDTPFDRQQNKETLQLAENIKAKRQLDLQNGTYGFIPPFKRQTDFIAYFEMLTNKRKETKVNYSTWKHVLGHLRKYIDGSIKFYEITDGWLEDFRDHLLSIVSPNSAFSYFNIVKAAIHKAYKDKIIADNPADRVESPKQVDTKREFLMIEEVQLLANTECRYPVLKNAFLFSCLTGLRWSDIQKMKWSEIQDTKENGCRIDFTQRKTKEVEYLPVSKQARKLLGEKGEPEERVFKGLRYSSYTNVALDRWMMKAGITKHITFHCARHTHATLLLTNGTDIYTVSKLLGHRNIQTTQIYAKIIDEKKVEAVNNLPEIQL